MRVIKSPPLLGKHRTGLHYVILIAMSLVLTLGTLVIPATVHEPDGLSSVWFGYPIPFVEQDLWRYTPPQSLFPITFHFDSPLGSPTRWLPIRFALSATMIFIVVLTLNFVLRGGKAHRDREPGADAR